MNKIENGKQLIIIIGKARSGKTTKCIEYLKQTKANNVIFDLHSEYAGIFKDEMCITEGEYEIGMLKHPSNIRIDGEYTASCDSLPFMFKCMDDIITTLKTRNDESWLLVVEDAMYFQNNCEKLMEYISDETKNNISLIMIYSPVDEIHKDVMENTTTLVDIKVEREEIVRYNRIIKQYNGADIERYTGINFTFNVYDEKGGRASLLCSYGSLFVVFNDEIMSAYQWSGVVKGKEKYFLHELEDIANERQILLEIDHYYFCDYSLLIAEGYILLNRFNRSLHRFELLWIKEGEQQ